MNEKNYRKEIKNKVLRDYLLKAGLKLTRNKTSAEDLVQDCLLKGLERCDQLRDPKKIKYWLYTIQKRIFFTQLTKLKGKTFFSYEELDWLLTDTAPFDITEWHSLSDGVQFSISKLQDKYKTPFRMFYLENLSYKEISQVLEIPAGTVMSRISRSKEILKKYLKQQGVTSFRGSFS